MGDDNVPAAKMVLGKWRPLDERRAQSNGETAAVGLVQERQIKDLNQLRRCSLLSERGRVLFSSAFRRLQRKAQVFALDGDAAVRSRLSHSLEVGHHSRAVSLGLSPDFIGVPGSVDSTKEILATMAEISSWLHDIGNPPFGHFGEHAIRTWFRSEGIKRWRQSVGWEGSDTSEGSDSPEGSHESEEPKTLEERESEVYDAVTLGPRNFDGNAQAIRVVARLSTPWSQGQYGMNLTRGILLSTVKYPYGVWSSKLKQSKPKACFFDVDAEIFEWLYGDCADQDKFIVAEIMDLGDEIAYLLSDVDDGVDKGLLDEAVALRAFGRLAGLGPSWFYRPPKDEQPTEDLGAKLMHLAAQQRKMHGVSDLEQTSDRLRECTTQAIYVSCRIFLSTHLQNVAVGRIEAGCPDNPVDDLSRANEVLGNLIKVRCFRSEEAEDVELGGHRVLSDLLDQFGEILTLSESEFRSVLAELEFDDVNDVKACGRTHQKMVRLVNRLPRKYCEIYLTTVQTTPPGWWCDRAYFEVHRNWEWLCRAHLLIDFVAGMTDDYAGQLHRTVLGVGR